MLNKHLEASLNEAYKFAVEQQHEFLTVEHLLLALLNNPDALEVLTACGANVERLKKRLLEFIEETSPLLPEDSDKEHETQPTVGFQRVLQRAVFQVQSSGSNEVSGANVLAAIFSEQESQSVYLLKKENVSRLDVLNYIAHGLLHRESEGEDAGDAVGFDGTPQTAQITSEARQNHSVLAQMTTDLNQKVKDGKIDPLVGRDEELMRVIQVLCRRRKNNPLLVGEPGVGKTAIAEGLAYRIVHEEVPPLLASSSVLTLDLGTLLAGTKYRGDFEKRMKLLLDEIKKKPEVIIFIDEIHTIIGAGSASGGSMDVSNLLKPLLASGELRCMGSTTYQEFRNVFEKDRALVRRFQKIDVLEPSIEQTIHILKGLKKSFEEHHGVTYTPQALKCAVELSERYLTDRFLPDKAIDVIDEAGALKHLQLSQDNKKSKTVDVNDIELMISKLARIPEKTVSQSDRRLIKNLDRDLKLVVFGQEQAIDTLVSAIKLSRSGLGDINKPVGSFLFAGPTGVGKTEVTLQLSKLMSIKLLRFDMSEYMEKHSVARLIGAPPGYVGHDQGGLLSDAVLKHPHAIVLFDEIEKAHPDIYNILLQVMDHGELTDSNGREVDFRHSIIVMTTNAGAQEMNKASIGFTHQDHSSDGMGEIKRHFSPEFRNRLDAIIQFKALGAPTIAEVVNKFIDELSLQLESQKVTLEVDEGARLWLAEHGYDRLMGARPMKRLIQEKLKKPLAEELLFGQLAEGGHVSVTTNKEGIKVKIAEPAKV